MLSNIPGKCRKSLNEAVSIWPLSYSLTVVIDIVIIVLLSVVVVVVPLLLLLFGF